MCARMCKSSRGWKRCKRALRRFEEVSRRFREGGWRMETVLFISLIKICSFPKFFNFFDDPLYGIHPPPPLRPVSFPRKIYHSFENSKRQVLSRFYFFILRRFETIREFGIQCLLKALENCFFLFFPFPVLFPLYFQESVRR